MHWETGINLPGNSSAACIDLAINPAGSCKGCRTAGSCTSLSLAPALEQLSTLMTLGYREMLEVCQASQAIAAAAIRSQGQSTPRKGQLVLSRLCTIF